MNSTLVSRFLCLALMLLGGCVSANVVPAIQSETAGQVVLTGQEKIAVLPLRITGYPLNDTPKQIDRNVNLVEIALMRAGFQVILYSSFKRSLAQLKYIPTGDLDIPSAKLMKKLTGADIVIEGWAGTFTVGVLNNFQETLYAVDARTGRLLLGTNGEGDSDTFVNCATELAKKLKAAVHKT